MSTKASCLSTFRSQKSLLLERNSMLDGFSDASQTATSAWIGFFAAAFASLCALRDAFLNLSVAGLTNVVPHCLPVISEAVA